MSIINEAEKEGEEEWVFSKRGDRTGTN